MFNATIEDCGLWHRLHNLNADVDVYVDRLINLEFVFDIILENVFFLNIILIQNLYFDYN